MTKRIWKYTLNALSEGSAVPQEVDMPLLSTIVHVGIQHPRLICLWAEVDDQQRKSHRYFTVVGTGQYVSDHAHYVGTVQEPPYVWHIYEED